MILASFPPYESFDSTDNFPHGIERMQTLDESLGG